MRKLGCNDITSIHDVFFCSIYLYIYIHIYIYNYPIAILRNGTASSRRLLLPHTGRDEARPRLRVNPDCGKNTNGKCVVLCQIVPVVFHQMGAFAIFVHLLQHSGVKTCLNQGARAGSMIVGEQCGGVGGFPLHHWPHVNSWQPPHSSPTPSFR